MAAAPHTSSTPRGPGRTSVAIRTTISSDSTAVKPTIDKLPKIPMESINVSRTIVPTIQPITATRAARSSRAEKNFWYIFASPSSKNIVGRNKAKAACDPISPNIDNWSGRSSERAMVNPPVSLTKNATPSMTAKVMSRPLPTSR